MVERNSLLTSRRSKSLPRVRIPPSPPEFITNNRIGMVRDEIIRAKFEKLLTEGNRILSQCGWNGDEFYKSPSDLDYSRFKTEVTNLVKQVCGESSTHFQEIRRLSENRDLFRNSHYFSMYYGTLEAVYNDYNDGFISDIRLLVSAEVLSDILEQADVLCKSDYYIPAASLAGAVLEDSLKKLCNKNNIPIPTKPGINKLNDLLAKEGLYTKLTHKSVTAYAEIRNNADHGVFEAFKKSDVEAMVKWVRQFQEEFLV